MKSAFQHHIHQRGAIMGATLMLLLVGGLFLSAWLSLMSTRAVQVSWLENAVQRRLSLENSRLLAWQSAMEHGFLPAHDLGSLTSGILGASTGGILPVKGWDEVDALASMLAPGAMTSVFPYNNTGLHPGPAFLAHATQIRPSALSSGLDNFTSHLFLKSRPPVLAGDLFIVYRKPDSAVTEIDVHKTSGAHHAYWQVMGRAVIRHPASLFARTTSRVDLPFRARSLYIQTHDPFNNTPVSGIALNGGTLLPSNLPTSPGTTGASQPNLLSSTTSTVTNTVTNTTGSLVGGQRLAGTGGKLIGGVTSGVTGTVGVVTGTVGGVTDVVGGVTDTVGGVTDVVGGVTDTIGGVVDTTLGLTEQALALLRASLTVETGRVFDGHLNVVRNDLHPSNSLHHIINREVTAGRAGVDEVDVYVKSSDKTLPWWMEEYTGLGGDRPPHPPPGYPSGYPTQFKTLYVRLDHPGLRHLRIRNVIHQIVFVGQSGASAFEAAGALPPVIVTLIQDAGQPVGNICFENENNRRLILGCRHPHGQKLDLSWRGAPVSGSDLRWRLVFINEHQSVWLALHDNPVINVRWIGGVMTNWFFKRYASTGPRADRLTFIADDAAPTLPHTGPSYASLLPRDLWLEHYFLPTPPSS
ncbi:MAG TPA: hypothetical protein DIT64_20170 [Verrucomicrobiales bacterium]|nr:hypothetical protein [Verrucomicrobiales bacterium]